MPPAVVVLLTALLALGAAMLPGAAARAAVCSPVGGAPGPLAGLGGSSGHGSIGPDASPIGDRAASDVVAELVGASSSPPPLACQAPDPGAAGPAEPASLPPASPGQSVGNPVNLITGNKYDWRIDVVMPDLESGLQAALREALGADAVHALGSAWQSFAPLALIFSRHYNSRFDTAGPLGPGWRHSFETALARLRAKDGFELQVVQADGRRIVFRRNGDRQPASYAGGQGSDGEITEDFAAELPWTWRWPDGRILRFDADGRLERVEAPDRDRILVHRDRAGRIRSLEDAAGRQLQLEYLGARLHAVVLPDGNRVRYDYDRHGVLVAVRYPDGRVVRHHYDDPRAFHLLTAVELPGGVSGRYRYDEALRVAESTPATRPGRRETVLLEYRLPEATGGTGETTVRQGGRVSRWQWQIDGWGRERIVSMSGKPCISCPAFHEASSNGPAPERQEPARPVLERPDVERSGLERPEPVRELAFDAFGLATEARIRGHARTGNGHVAPIAMHLRWQRHLTGPLAGKLAWVERVAPDGTAARTTFFHDSRRALVTIVRPGELIHRLQRDALGRATVQHRADRARLEARFDAAWRLTAWRVRNQTTAVSWNDSGLPGSIAWPSGDHWTLRWRTHDVDLESNRGWIARSTEDDRESGGARAPRGAAVALALARPDPVIVDAAGRRTELLYDDFGRLAEENSSVAGFRRFRHDAWGRVIEVASPLGVVERRRYDLAGRLLEREQLDPSERILTRFEWQGALLAGIDHPAQQTRVEHDDAGRVLAIEHRLFGARQRWSFERNDDDRIVSQSMPDGSRLLHRFDEAGRPSALLFQAPARKPITIVDAARYRSGHAVSWRFGNGLRFQRENDRAGRPMAWRWLGGTRLPGWQYSWQDDGLPAAIAGRDGERRFGWDVFGRLIVEERHPRSAGTGADKPEAEYFAWDLAGDLRLAKRADGSTWRSAEARVPYDVLGRPSHYSGFDLQYGAQQRIVAVDRPSAPVARYSYNAAGERTTKSANGETTGFLYRGRRLAAEIDETGRLTRHYLYWLGSPVAIVERHDSGSRVFWLHTDHLGTPHAATDTYGRPVWSGRYEAFGRLSSERGGLRQPLRFAGQYHDAETGLHDNYLRSYDPSAARYLEPDPMGLAAGLNPRTYADGNPLMGADPLGLILFAFDGTNNGDPAPGKDDISNVRKFYQIYDSDRAWYMSGVGLDDPESGIRTNPTDVLNANTARARVDYMFSRLDEFLNDDWIGRTANIDVIGFSRGAAMARDFVNRVAHFQEDDYWWAKGICVNLRFLGLWDTVAQFGTNGIDNDRWTLSIPSTVNSTYHAVALNEHRSLFPLEAAIGAAVVERGFIGSHADVGGGNAEGDLSDISLIWMTKMARQVGIEMDSLSSEYLTVNAPILHDRNDQLGDRNVHVRGRSGAVASRINQKEAAIAGMTWVESQPFIIAYPQARRDANDKPSIAGEVDMHAYADWLRAEYAIEVTVR